MMTPAAGTCSGGRCSPPPCDMAFDSVIRRVPPSVGPFRPGKPPLQRLTDRTLPRFSLRPPARSQQNAMVSAFLIDVVNTQFAPIELRLNISQGSGLHFLVHLRRK